MRGSVDESAARVHRRGLRRRPTPQSDFARDSSPFPGFITSAQILSAAANSFIDERNFGSVYVSAVNAALIKRSNWYFVIPFAPNQAPLAMSNSDIFGRRRKAGTTNLGIQV